MENKKFIKKFLKLFLSRKFSYDLQYTSIYNMCVLYMAAQVGKRFILVKMRSVDLPCGIKIAWTSVKWRAAMGKRIRNKREIRWNTEGESK